MKIIVSSTEMVKGDYGEYLKVNYKDKNGKEAHRNIGIHWERWWGEFTKGRLIELKYRQDDNNKWILQEIIPAELPDKSSEENPLVKHAIKEGAVIDKPSGQEVGMTTKEIGDMIRADKLSVIFGAEPAKELVEWYKNRIKGTTGVK